MAGVELPIASFLGLILVLIPLPWNWRARNVATLVMNAWLILMNFVQAVNTIAWRGNFEIRLVVWCDITTKLLIGYMIGLPASAMCICRYLEDAGSNRRATISSSDKRKRLYFDCAICFGLPVLFMALHYIVQGHRFDIYENYGCYPSTYASWQAVLLLSVPPLALSLATFVYAGFAFRWFVTMRIRMASILREKSTGLTTGRFLRLMGMSLTNMLWGTSLSTVVMVQNINDYGLRPYISWAYVHENFSRIDRYPMILLPSKQQVNLSLGWWVTPSTSFLFFLFFGFGAEAMNEYQKNFNWFRRRILRQNPPASGHSTITSVTPIMNSRSSYLSAKPHTLDDTASFDTVKLQESLPSGAIYPSAPQEPKKVFIYTTREVV